MKILFAVIVIVMIGCESPEAKVIRLEKSNQARFERVGKVVIQHYPVRSLEGIVYRDRETGFEYLFVGDGVNGIAMTRLWEKESNNESP